MARPADPYARASLIAAARSEFVKSGILKARIEDITLACGLSKGAFYLHFDSKEALFRELAEVLEGEFERMLADRQKAYVALLEARTGVGEPRGDANFIKRKCELDAREDRRTLEVLWTWRDVIDVLLRGCQGTEFDGVMWEMLDQQLSRVREECRALQQLRLMRADVSPEMLGMMVVGTYLVVVRRLVQAKEKPDFDELVKGLQQVMAGGMAATTKSQSKGSPPRARRAKLASRLSSSVTKNRSSR